MKPQIIMKRIICKVRLFCTGNIDEHGTPLFEIRSLEKQKEVIKGTVNRSLLRNQSP